MTVTGLPTRCGRGPSLPVHALPLLLFGVAVVLAYGGSGAWALGAPRGVDPARASRYSDKTDFFSCLDGTRQVPFTWVNDDYCDCVDGSDEPGTSACANGSFYCQNRGHSAKDLPSAMVDDGICDCCDGSDEPKGRCGNTCLALGASARTARKARLGRMREGVSARHVLEAEAEAARRSWSEQDESLAKQVLEAQHEVAHAKAREDNERAKFQAARAAYAEAQKNGNTVDPVPDAGDAAAAQGEAEDDAVPTDGAAAQQAPTSGATGGTSGAAHGGVGEEADEVDGAELGRKIAAQWTHDPVEGDYDYGYDAEAAEESAPGGDYDYALDEAPAAGADDDYDLPAPPGARASLNAAEKATRDAESRLSKLQSERKQLEKTGSRDYGPDGVFAGLVGKCYDVRVEKYTYSVCPFENAYQKENGGATKLGSWAGFRDNYGSMVFENGLQCWQGPKRSLEVVLECSSETSLARVEEPSRCEYSTTLYTPAVCNAAALLELEAEIAAEEAVIGSGVEPAAPAPAGHEELK